MLSEIKMGFTDKIKLYPLYFDNEFCMEIDNYKDLEKAKAYLKFNKA